MSKKHPLNRREVVPPVGRRSRPTDRTTTKPTTATLSQSDATTTPSTDLRAPLRIEHLPLDALIPSAGNARVHTDRQIGLVAASIQAFGFVNPIGIDAAGVVVFGHARLEAARRLGLATVPVVRLEHLTPAQVRAYRLADNRLAELSTWDEDLLRLEVESLASLELAGELGFDLGVVGFETAELDVILGGGTGPGGDLEPAESVELPGEGAVAVTRLGDLWHLGEGGRHWLLCGDALDPASYKRLLPSPELARLVFTDPPYNVPIAGHVRIAGRKGGRTQGTSGGRGGARAGQGTPHREFAMGVGELNEEGFTSMLQSSVQHACEVAVEGAIVMVFMDWKHQHELLTATRRLGLAHLNTCVWNKTNGGMGSLYRSKHEFCGVFRHGTDPHLNNVQLGRYGRYRTNVWDYAGVNTFRRGREADLADHPTVKPTPLVMDAIKDVTRRGELVLDMFGGSGTTMLAAERTGRRARLVELDPLYVDVTLRRWEALTGEQAVLAATGQTFAEVKAAREAEGQAKPEAKPDAREADVVEPSTEGIDADEEVATAASSAPVPVPVPVPVARPPAKPVPRVRVRAGWGPRSPSHAAVLADLALADSIGEGVPHACA